MRHVSMHAARTGVSLLVVVAAIGCGAQRAEPIAQPAAASVDLNPSPAATPICPLRFVDVTATSGVVFYHTDGSSGRHYIPETVTAGLATFDYDNDGLVDIYFPNGAALPGTTVNRPARHALFRNLGACRFQEVTELAGVPCTGYGLGVTAADFDNDGDVDLYVSQFGPNVLYRNNGDGTFTDVTISAGVSDGGKLGAGVVFFDMEGDGDLDLFVANYLKFSYETHIVLYGHGVAEYVGPRAYPPEYHTLYRNEGDGRFTDASQDSGIAQHPGKGMGVVAADYDGDGDTDLFVLNDVFENFCFANDGHGHFREIALLNGFKYNGEGMALGSMGVDCGDYDNDGWLDLYQTSYQNELPVLFRNLGNGLFEDVTVRSGAGQGTLNNVKWGCGFVDFDNDGHRDLFVAMGHLQDLIDQWDSSTSYRTRNVVLRNNGKGRFIDVSKLAGIADLAPHSARGACFEDFDNDGDVDVVILNSREAATVLRNMYYEKGGTNHYLALELRGRTTNRDAVGARVQVNAGELVLVDEVHSGRGYQSHWGSRLHFGLGKHQRVERVTVRWIGGHRDTWEDLPADRTVRLSEGDGVAQPIVP